MGKATPEQLLVAAHERAAGAAIDLAQTVDSTPAFRNAMARIEGGDAVLEMLDAWREAERAWKDAGQRFAESLRIPA